MQHIKSDVATICIGMAASMGAVLLAGGAKGKRSALPNSEMLLHQVMGGAQGQASDIEISARHIIDMKKRLNEILALHTGQKLDRVTQDADRDFYLLADEAKKYGLIDNIIQPTK